MSPHENDSDDPWTFFGEFSKDEIDRAALLLADAKIRFEVKEGTPDSDSGWSGPFALWVYDEAAAEASALLVPFFAAQEKRKG